jgi:hypothetical protein
MRDPKRIDNVLKELGGIWKQFPDLRLGQLIINVNQDPYYIEDDELIELIRHHYREVIHIDPTS